MARERVGSNYDQLALSDFCINYRDGSAFHNVPMDVTNWSFWPEQLIVVHMATQVAFDQYDHNIHRGVTSLTQPFKCHLFSSALHFKLG